MADLEELVLSSLIAGLVAGIYLGVYEVFSFEEMVLVALAAITTRVFIQTND